MLLYREKKRIVKTILLVSAMWPLFSLLIAIIAGRFVRRVRGRGEPKSGAS